MKSEHCCSNVSTLVNTVVVDDQKRSHQIAHTLHVTDVQVFPDISAHNIPQLFQVLVREVPEVAVTSLNIFVDTMNIKREQIQ